MCQKCDRAGLQRRNTLKVYDRCNKPRVKCLYNLEGKSKSIRLLALFKQYSHLVLALKLSILQTQWV
jgi:hypothetical protein